MIRLVYLGLVLAPLASAQPISVTADSVARLGVSQTYRAPAQVVSLNESVIAAEVEAVVSRVHADVGTEIRAGQTLVTLDSIDLELASDRIDANIESTQARIREAELRLRRARNLKQGQFVSEDDLLARETELNVLVAELKRQRIELRSARRDVEKCSIRAPFDGVVTHRAAHVGSLLRRGDPVLTLVDIRRFELDAEIPSQHRDVLPGASAMDFVAAATRWPVVLERLSPVIEPGQRISRARFRFAGAAPPIGTSGELSWRVSGGFLPADLLVRRGGALGVFVVDGERARYVALDGAQEGRPIAHGLADGTLVIVDGRERLNDGDPVEVVRR